MIPFNKPPFTKNEEKYVLDAMSSQKFSGDGFYSKKCHTWFERKLNCAKALLTPNCTQALEMAAILIDVQPGDEIIMPSFTFVSTANAFVLRGAKIVFVDVIPGSMNIDEELVEKAITQKTKAIVPVHYAGMCCDMHKIMDIANRHNLFVIEDAAQAMMSSFEGKPLGTFGHLAALSFHETKNYTSGGEGGLLIINDDSFIERAEIIREKGTNRSKFFRGAVDKYSWVDLGSSYLPCDLQAAYLWGQLEFSDIILADRLSSWERYNQGLADLASRGTIELPEIPVGCSHNGHMFYIKVKDLDERQAFISYLAEQGVMAVFHYIPLHSSSAGLTYGEFCGKDVHTTKESERLVRLPLFYGLSSAESDHIIKSIVNFFDAK
ncbi:dTDP-4-amino-4,6-dideoxygalactose transaminase [Shewanella fodinae]|uniref:dTDP-4-amino-4,6-dideoxygalactose transaminase n=1 Tax=Shewanella fodinae TaxID=552357 RepID=UPI00167B67F0|nr:dTDP-4-amino-4,6-dideoxygalactose transaminase [Shewanella fodinae]MCL2906289.1 dTDP-4-amino-4,6-dideoxygalactose transaminase [Shewanella fodinae]GGZ00499.1 dTDP-4-amino-4,6-dideoxygalactose transaminase [Shewanella fodinae]